MLAGYAAGDNDIRTMIDSVLSSFKASPSALFSVLGRHAARALECRLVAQKLKEWSYNFV